MSLPAPPPPPAAFAEFVRKALDPMAAHLRETARMVTERAGPERADEAKYISESILAAASIIASDSKEAEGNRRLWLNTRVPS